MLLNPETVENASIRFNVVQHENGAFQKRCRQMSAFSVRPELPNKKNLVFTAQISQLGSTQY